MFLNAPSDINDVSYLDTFQGLADDGNRIFKFLTFKEPNKFADSLGNISPAYRAQTRADNISQRILPLQNIGIRACLSIPAVLADHGQHWLEDFLGNCLRTIGKYHTYDFVAFHWHSPL